MRKPPIGSSKGYKKPGRKVGEMRFSKRGTTPRPLKSSVIKIGQKKAGSRKRGR